jgi:pulcherriminic acid synthase
MATTVGMNGVAITRRTGADKAYRTYEVHQRRRVGDARAPVHPRALINEAFLRDPYPTLALLREHTPCHRDWVGNAYWVTRYDDVTSVFVDDASFASRPKRAAYGVELLARDFGAELAVQRHIERVFDTQATPIAARLADTIASRGEADLALGFAASLSLELIASTWGIPRDDAARFAERHWRLQRGVTGNGVLEQAGRDAYRELVDYFTGLAAARRRVPGDDLVSVIVALDPDATAHDLVATLLESDHETLHGALANLWWLLLTHPDELERVRAGSAGARLMKLAYLEALRHSTPVLAARRFARHEVERFGLLIPEGALVVCAAAAANRDPRVFAEPDRFIVGRRDLTQREPRGQYRADGLASGIAFGLGVPTKHPAVPEDRPRSRYAIVRDAAVRASTALCASLPRLALAPDATVGLRSLAVGEMHTCWHLPVVTR